MCPRIYQGTLPVDLMEVSSDQLEKSDGKSRYHHSDVA
jgi:hypothetical protein